MKTKLSVNINKVALIRNSRNSNIPDIVAFAQKCEEYGADGITVHPRPDERHIRYSDLDVLKEIVTTELNIEGYPSERFMDKVLTIMPDQCTLVPDPPGVLTSNEGWNILQHKAQLKLVLEKLKSAGIRTSLFIDPVVERVEQAKEVGSDRIEIYTGDYAIAYPSDREKAVEDHVKCSIMARSVNIGVNAGHDLNLDNLQYYAEQLEGLQEVSIGHALVSDALYYGIENVIGMYKNLL